MSKPWIHAESSARRWGGKPEDYIEIHNLLDSSKGTIADSRHRALTHNAWFLSEILERIFSVVIPISVCGSCGRKTDPERLERRDGYDICFGGEFGEHIFTPKRVSVRDVGEQHVLEDYSGRFIPSAQDFLELVPQQDWMLNGKNGSPPSFRKIEAQTKVKKMHISFDKESE